MYCQLNAAAFGAHHQHVDLRAVRRTEGLGRTGQRGSQNNPAGRQSSLESPTADWRTILTQIGSDNINVIICLLTLRRNALSDERRR